MRVFPSRHMVVGIDDSPHVWTECQDYIIKIQKYSFFKDKYASKDKMYDHMMIISKDLNDNNSYHGDFIDENKNDQVDNFNNENYNNDGINNNYDNHINENDINENGNDEDESLSLYFSMEAYQDKSLSIMERILKQVYEKFYNHDQNQDRDCGVSFNLFSFFFIFILI